MPVIISGVDGLLPGLLRLEVAAMGKEFVFWVLPAGSMVIFSVGLLNAEGWTFISAPGDCRLEHKSGTVAHCYKKGGTPLVLRASEQASKEQKCRTTLEKTDRAGQRTGSR